MRRALRRALADVAAARSIIASSIRGGSDARGPFCYVVGSGWDGEAGHVLHAWSGRSRGVVRRGLRYARAFDYVLRELRPGGLVLAETPSPGASDRLAVPRCGLCGGLCGGGAGREGGLMAELAMHPVFGNGPLAREER